MSQKFKWQEKVSIVATCSDEIKSIVLSYIDDFIDPNPSPAVPPQSPKVVFKLVFDQKK